MLSAYNFIIIYRKKSENVRVDTLSRRQDYSGKPTERPRQMLREIEQGLEYNYEVLATVSIVENEGFIV